jgi:hypothetical protein
MQKRSVTASAISAVLELGLADSDKLIDWPCFCTRVRMHAEGADPAAMILSLTWHLSLNQLAYLK